MPTSMALTINMNSVSKKEFSAMGTNISVEIVLDNEKSKENVREGLDEIEKIFRDLEKIFSRFDPESELSKINGNLNQELNISETMADVLLLSLQFNKIFEGYFDPRIIANLEKIGYDKDFRKNNFNISEAKEIIPEKIEPPLENDLFLNFENKKATVKKRIDLAGIVKGYAVDKVSEYLKKEGFKNFIVEAGGDMYASGKNEENNFWTIDIEGLPKEKMMFKIKSEGIATSGISRKRWSIGDQKFHHLINPKDPKKFSFELKSATVIAQNAIEADAIVKSLFLMGKEKGMEMANKNNLKVLFLDYKGNAYLSQKIKENLS
jgi:thiamine biosynthesis lipoprotein